MQKAEKHTGTEQYGKFVMRLLRSYAKKAQNGDMDITALEQLAEIQAHLEQQMAETAAALRTEAGGSHSWAEIGRALGISREQAYKRYGHLDDSTVRKVGGQPGRLR